MFDSQTRHTSSLDTPPALPPYSRPCSCVGAHRGHNTAPSPSTWEHGREAAIVLNSHTGTAMGREEGKHTNKGRAVGRRNNSHDGNKGASREHATRGVDDKDDVHVRHMTCGLCTFIVVSVVVGIISVTTISFAAFFKADFDSYLNVYNESSQYINSDVSHTCMWAAYCVCATTAHSCARLLLFVRSRGSHHCGGLHRVSVCFPEPGALAPSPVAGG